MGWTSMRSRPGWNAARHCAAQLRWSGLDETQKPQIVKSVTTREAVFFAMKFPAAYFERRADQDAVRDFRGDYLAAADGSVTVPFIFRYQLSRSSFAFKNLDETAGFDIGAPSHAFLDALSPLAGPGPSPAHAFREKSRQAIESAYKARRDRESIRSGDRVTLAEPLRFQNGATVGVFTALRLRYRGKERLTFRSDSGDLYQLNAEQIANATVTRCTPNAHDARRTHRRDDAASFQM